MDTLAYTVNDAVKVSSIGRTKIYQAIREGDLKVIKIGRRTLIPAESLKTFLQRLTC